MTGFHYYRYRPSRALAPYVECIWGVRGAADYSREAVLPNGVVELMINFGPTQKVHAYGEREVEEPFHRAWLAGIQDQRLIVGSPEGSDHMGVRFRPGGAHAFFDVPMHEVTNQVVELDDLVGPRAAELRDRAAAAATEAERARAVEAWLLDRRYAVHPHYATIRRGLDLLHGSNFGMSVTELCDRLGLSSRHVLTQFRKVVGLSPKTMSRIARFQAVVEATEGEDDVDWSRLAFRFGYADQPHLVREFRRFAGVTPTEFMARRTPEESHVVVG